jgi:hypothetical protein
VFVCYDNNIINLSLEKNHGLNQAYTIQKKRNFPKTRPIQHYENKIGTNVKYVQNLTPKSAQLSKHLKEKKQE